MQRRPTMSLAILLLVTAACQITDPAGPPESPSASDGLVAPDVELGSPEPDQPVSQPPDGYVAPDVELGSPEPDQPVSQPPVAPDMELGSPTPEPTVSSPLT